MRQSVQVEEIMTYGKDHLPSGPNVQDSDAIIIVEGRSDVLNLLKSGIKNAIAVEGTNIPRTIVELSKERVITAFVDGDRGGELILRELFQLAEVDFVARAPRGMEVEELTQKQIMKCLRNKIPGEQYMEMYGLSAEGKERAEPEPEKPEHHVERPEKAERAEKAEKPHREPREKRERPRYEKEPREVKEREPVAPVEAEPAEEPEPFEEAAPSKHLSDAQMKYRTLINELGSTSKAKIMGADLEIIKEVPVRELVNTLKADAEGVTAVVFDGIITQRILDIASDKKIATIVGTKMGNITKQPAAVEVWSKEDLNE